MIVVAHVDGPGGGRARSVKRDELNNHERMRVPYSRSIKKGRRAEALHPWLATPWRL